MRGRERPDPSIPGGRAGASDVGLLPIVDAPAGARVFLFVLLGVGVELGVHAGVVGLEANRVVDSAALPLIDAAASAIGVAAAFFWILYRPFRARWRAREGDLRYLLRSRAELEHSLTKVFETMSVALAFLDGEGRPVRTNESFRSLLGSEAETRGKALHEILEMAGLPECVSRAVRGEGGGRLLARATTRLGVRMLNVELTAVSVSPGGGSGAFLSIDDETAQWAQSEELQKSEEFYRAVVEESRDMILRLAPDGRVLMGNSAGKRMIEALGERSPGSLLPDSRATHEEIEKVRGRRAGLTPENPSVIQSASVVLADGRTHRFEWTELAFFDRERRLTEFHLVGRDVTELAETRLRLEESEARYRTLFTGSLTALLIVDPIVGTLVDANPRAAELTGCPATELRGRRVAALFRNEGPERVDEILRPAAGQEPSSAVETILLARDGRQVPVEVTTGRMADWDGKPLVLLAVRDASRRKAEEAARAAREAELRALFHAAPIGIGLFRNRICIEANEGFAAITGYVPAELIGRPSRMFYASDEAYEETGRKLYDPNFIRDEGVGGTTVRLVRKDGGSVDVLLVSAPFDPADPAKGVAVAALDVTERLAMEAEMRKNDVLLRLLSGNAPAILWTTDDHLEITSALGAPLLEETAESAAPRRSIEELFGGTVLPDGDIRELHRSALESGSAAFVFERRGRFFDASVEALRDASGGARGLVGVAFDTSARRIAEQRSERRWRQLQVLHSIARAALGPAESRQVFCAVAAEMRREFRVPLVAISLVDRREGRTILAGVSWEPPDPGSAASVTPRAPFDATLAGEVVQTGRTLLRAGSDIGGRPVEAGLEAFAIRGYVGAPLRSAGEIVGVLSLASDEGLEVSEKDVPWLEAASEFVALVVERRQAGDDVLKLSRAVEQSRVTVLVLNPDARIEYANRCFFDSTGFTPEGVLGRDPSFLRCPDHAVETYLESWKALKSGQEWSGEIPIRIADGSTRWVSVVHSPVKDGAGRATNVVTVAEDVTERRLADEELQRSREKLRALWARLVTLQEDERRALSQSLHEGLGQTLAGIAYGMSWVGRRLGPEQQGAAEELSRLGTEANRAIEEVRDLTRNLRPATLDLDPVAALETEIAAFRQRTGIPCTFSSDPESIALDADRTMVLYRVLQEGLRNAALHGDPGEVDVRVRLERDVLRLEVADDGRGIDRSRPQPVHALGLREIRERVASVGGGLRVESNRPRGTLLVAEIPMPADGEGRRL